MGEWWNKFIGQPDPNLPPGLAIPQPSFQETLLRSLGGAVPPPGQLRVSNTAGGRILGTLARVGSGFAGVSAEEMARMRMDPVVRMLRMGQQGLQGASGVMVPGSLPSNNLAPYTPPEPGLFPLADATFTVPSPTDRPSVPGAVPYVAPGPPASLQEFLQHATPAQRTNFMMARMAGIPESAFYRDTLREAQTKRAELEAGPLGQAQLEQARAATAASGATTVETTRKTEAGREQNARDKAFSEEFGSRLQADPQMTSEQRAALAGELAAKHRPSTAVTQPILGSLEREDNLAYHRQDLEISKANIVRQKAEFATRIERGDLESARQIVNSEIQRLEAFKKEKQGALVAVQNSISKNNRLLADYATQTNPALKALIENDTRMDRLSAEALSTMIREIEPELVDARTRLKSLFAQTKVGKQVLREQPTPQLVPAPPGLVPGGGVFLPGQSPVTAKTLEEYKRLRGR